MFIVGYMLDQYCLFSCSNILLPYFFCLLDLLLSERDVLIYPVVIDQFLLSVLFIYQIRIETVGMHLCWIRMVKSSW